MIRLLLIFALALPAQAQTDQQKRDCFSQRAGEVASIGLSGAWSGFWCPDGIGDWRAVVMAAPLGYRVEMPTSAAGTPADVAVAYWNANVKVPCADASIVSLCNAAKTALEATRPLPPWIVRPNGSYTTRPIYDLVNGVRSKTASGSVNIKDASGRPMACNYAVRVVEGSSVYAQIPNVEPVRVALCSKSSS
jgi:hypothetical protein